MTCPVEWSEYPESFRQQVHLLQQLMRYIRHVPMFNSRDASVELEASGRFHDARAYVLYWPHLLTNVRYINRLVEMFFGDERALLRRAKQNGFSLRDLPPAGVPRNTWQLVQVRSALEQAAGALLLPPTSTEAIERAHTYAYSIPLELRDERRNGADAHALFDMQNYTVIRKVSAFDEPILRTIVAPPAWPQIKDYFDHLPEPLRWLYHAWVTIASREFKPYDPATVGIEFTKHGYIFINWNRFALSEFFPASLREKVLLRADQVADALYDLKIPRRRERGGKNVIVLRPCRMASIRRCIAYPVDLRAVVGGGPGPALGSTFYLKQCRAIGYGNFDDPNTADRCTIVDPIRLATRTNLFQGYRYYQLEHAGAAQRAAFAYRQRIGAAPKAFPRVYEFAFKPGLYAGEIREALRCSDYPLWFEDLVEPIYAVNRKGQLSFTNPKMIKQHQLEHSGDWAVWSRVMDTMGLIQGLADDNSLGEIQERSRSDWYRKMHRHKLGQLASAVIKEYTSFDDLSGRKRKQLSHTLNKDFLRSGGGEGKGGSWYSTEKARLAKDLVPISAFRRVLTVLLPGHETPQEKTYFYTETAVRAFHKSALASLGHVPSDLIDPITQTMYVFASPAPYIYAWARFCMDMQRQGTTFAVTCTASAAVREKLQLRQARREARAVAQEPEEKVSAGTNERWTPPEDYVLLRRYHKFPHMSPKERRELLDLLPLRTQTNVSQRVAFFDKIFRRYLTDGRRRECSLFEHSLSDAAAKRAIILAGCHVSARHLGHTLHKKHPVVGDIFRLEDAALATAELPPKYGVQFYVKYFNPNVV